jgi:predicted P-loop ATPase
MRELRGLWIAEMSELDSLRGREASTVKRLLSAPSDRFVEKYQTHAERYPRRAVAVATTNEAEYWQDSTGARRLVPIVAGDIRIDIIRSNRLQWFAEARHLYKAGATWWEFPSAIEAAREARQQVDPWEDLLRDVIARGRKTGNDDMGRVLWPDGPIASADIMRDWLRLDAHQQGQAASTRLGRVMRRLGYVPVRIGHARDRGWQRADTSRDAKTQVSAQVSAPSSL